MRWTQRAIKQVLTERYYSWRDAELIAQKDPEIDLSGNGPLYSPMNFEPDDTVPESGAESEQDLLRDIPPEELKPAPKTASTSSA